MEAKSAGKHQNSAGNWWNYKQDLSAKEPGIQDKNAKEIGKIPFETGKRFPREE